MVFEAAKKKKMEASGNARQKQVRRAVLLIKRAKACASADVIEKAALWKLEQAIPDDIKREAYVIVESDSSVSGLAEKVGGREDPMKDQDVDKRATVEKGDGQPAPGGTVSMLLEITSQPNMIEALAADLKADGVEVTEEEVREYLAGVDFDAIVRQVGGAPSDVA